MPRRPPQCARVHRNGSNLQRSQSEGKNIKPTTLKRGPNGTAAAGDTAPAPWQSVESRNTTSSGQYCRRCPMEEERERKDEQGTTKQNFMRRRDQIHRTGAQGTCKHHRKTGNACKKVLKKKRTKATRSPKSAAERPAGAATTKHPDTR